MAIGHHAPGELVDDFDAPVADDVVDVAPQEHLRMQRTAESREQAQVGGIVQAAATKLSFDVLDAGIRQFDVAAVLVAVEVLARDERRNQRREPRRERDLSLDATGDHQRHPCLVDHDRVGLVDKRQVKRSVHEIARFHHEAIAQVIEARFLGRDVGDVGEVRGTPCGWRHPLLHAANREAKPAINGAHPLAVARGKIVVEGEDVDAAIAQCTHGRCQHGGQRLAFPGEHLDHAAIIEGQRGQDLLVERALTQGAMRGLASQSEELVPDVVACLAAARSLAEAAAALEYRFVRQCLAGGFEPGNAIERLAIAGEIETDGGAPQLTEVALPVLHHSLGC